MRWVRALVAFVYDFVVGDDWRVALGVLAGLLGTVLLVRAGVNAWWALPLAAAAAMGVSLGRALRRSS